ncbi:MAG TPA: hypothetical protein VEK77_09050 [Gemmatimonadales bacterium]|nr:hypothetical protein [Gemmatimonadales bacterium]
MKRLSLLLFAAALVVPRMAQAQGLTMQMGNGWKFTFAGNVNVFWVFTSDENGPSNSSVRTGLLPAFATFAATGKEGSLDLGVHVGFGNQIQNANGAHDQFGTQIDLRQVFLTIGFKGGSQILAGRELGLYQRQNILNDMTLFGVGAVGGPQGGGTTLGRIGYGYIYPNFNAQITFSSPAKNPVQFSVGAFQPAVMGDATAGDPTTALFAETQLPRLEAEVTWNRSTGSSKWLVWVGGQWQKAEDAAGASVNGTGVTAGVRGSFSDLTVVVAAYTAKGTGTALAFFGDELAGDASERPSDGGYAQATYKSRKTTFGLSYGISRLKGTTSGDGTDASIGEVSSWTGGVYHQWTKSLKLVGEVTRERNDLSGAQAVLGGLPNRTDVSGGFMLFF